MKYSEIPIIISKTARNIRILIVKGKNETETEEMLKSIEEIEQI